MLSPVICVKNIFNTFVKNNNIKKNNNKYIISVDKVKKKSKISFIRGKT